MEITVNSSLEELFNAFIADEMWAALSYRNAAFASKGRALKFANGIFRDNSDEEFEHMEELVDMAKSLGIEVTFNLKAIVANCTTPYTELSPEEDTERLVREFIESEKRAIDGYRTALNGDAVRAKPELIQFFGEIANDEHDHLAELEDCLSDIESGRDDRDYGEEEDEDDEGEDFDDGEDGDDVDSDGGDDADESVDGTPQNGETDECSISESASVGFSMAGMCRQVFESIGR